MTNHDIKAQDVKTIRAKIKHTESFIIQSINSSIEDFEDLVELGDVIVTNSFNEILDIKILVTTATEETLITSEIEFSEIEFPVMKFSGVQNLAFQSSVCTDLIHSKDFNDYKASILQLEKGIIDIKTTSVKVPGEITSMIAVSRINETSGYVWQTHVIIESNEKLSEIKIIWGIFNSAVELNTMLPKIIEKNIVSIKNTTFMHISRTKENKLVKHDGNAEIYNTENVFHFISEDAFTLEKLIEFYPTLFDQLTHIRASPSSWFNPEILPVVGASKLNFFDKHDSPDILLGRSGTGKTTTLVTKMWNEYFNVKNIY